MKKILFLLLLLVSPLGVFAQSIAISPTPVVFTVCGEDEYDVTISGLTGDQAIFGFDANGGWNFEATENGLLSDDLVPLFSGDCEDPETYESYLFGTWHFVVVPDYDEAASDSCQNEPNQYEACILSENFGETILTLQISVYSEPAGGSFASVDFSGATQQTGAITAELSVNALQIILLTVAVFSGILLLLLAAGYVWFKFNFYVVGHGATGFAIDRYRKHD